jgi:Asp-tRNA(Asn)/Glu-tRNA(Gln) amidotransferase A subunit family amidase
VLRPASFCGIIGFKPTYGAINRGNLCDNYSQNCIGTLSATLEDGWAVCHEIAERVGGDPGFPPFAGGATPAPPRHPSVLAVLETAGWEVADADAKQALQIFLHQLAADGVKLADRRTSKRVEALEAAIAGIADIAHGINAWEMQWPFGELATRHRELLSEPLRERLEQGSKMTPDEYRMLLKHRDFAREMLQSLAGDIDACVTLSACGVAPLGIASTGDAIFNAPGSALRTPAISLPMLSVNGLPVGVQLLGFPGQERDLSALAAYVLSLTPVALGEAAA